MDFLLQTKITSKSGVSLTFCFAPYCVPLCGSDGFTLFRYEDHTQAKSTGFTCLTAVLGRRVVLLPFITEPI